MRNIARCNLLKSATLALLMASSALATETNTFTFTNKAGRVYCEVRITGNTGDGILYLETNGVSGGKVKFRDLDPELARQLGYNQVSATIAEFREKRQREALEREAQARAATEAHRKWLAGIEATRMVIDGKILQKIPEGLLVDSMSEDRYVKSNYRSLNGAEASRVTTREGQFYNGLCLLLGYPGYDRVVDGDVVHAVGFPDGEFTYKTVQDASRTVRRFQIRPEAVKEIADAVTLEAIRKEGVRH